MSLADVMTATIEYVGDVLVNDCGEPIPARVLRYHGIQGPPQDKICDTGATLSVDWERGFAVQAFPADGGTTTRSKGCPARPAFVLGVHYDVCWQVPRTTKGGEILTEDATWDADAGRLADVAECVERALLRLICGAPSPDDPGRAVFFDAMVAATGGQVAFRETVPGIGGGAARVTWRVIVGIAPNYTGVSP